MKHPFKYLYGPVASWRLGISLGLDPLATQEKACNFDCIYCQLGKTKVLTNTRRVFIETKELLQEVEALPKNLQVDYLTFSGRGEPTLAVNLGAMIHCLRNIRPEPIAVITNSSLMHLPDVRYDLSLADFVVAKLDACCQDSFSSIDQAGSITFQDILDGIFQFRRAFPRRFALQIMLIEENLSSLEQMANLVKLIKPDEVQLNTPLRPCAVGFLPPSKIEKAKSYFNDLNVVTVYDAPAKSSSPIDDLMTVRRHGNYRQTRSYTN